MPTVTSPNLTLSESNGIVTMTIVFIPTLSSFERELAAFGCTYDAHYSVHGVDNGVPGAELTAVDIPNMPIPVNGLLPPLPVMQQVTVARSRLQEDLAAGDNDELKVKIQIHSHVPPEYTPGVYTDQEVLTTA